MASLVLMILSDSQASEESRFLMASLVLMPGHLTAYKFFHVVQEAQPGIRDILFVWGKKLNLQFETALAITK